MAKAKAKKAAAKAAAEAKVVEAKAKAKANGKGKPARMADKVAVFKGVKIVSMKKSDIGKKSKWSRATAKARAAKGYTGFKAIKKGTSFYEKAKEFMAEM